MDRERTISPDTPPEHRHDWHYIVPRGENAGKERCDRFGEKCPLFVEAPDGP